MSLVTGNNVPKCKRITEVTDNQTAPPASNKKFDILCITFLNQIKRPDISTQLNSQPDIVKRVPSYQSIVNNGIEMLEYLINKFEVGGQSFEPFRIPIMEIAKLSVKDVRGDLRGIITSFDFNKLLVEKATDFLKNR
jgi:hypothetical protein